jgi:polysaccharide pyruvyl transferase WcaK-like protein
MTNLFSIRPKGFNIGNDVIYLGINHFVRMAFKKNYNVISIPATGKYESQKKAGLSSQTVYEINQYGNGVIVGGGNLYENGELEINPVALKALEKPMMIFSVSRGKIYNNNLKLVDRTDVMTDDKMALINRYADVSLSRDQATADHITALGEKTIVGGCPTLFINEIPQHLVPLLDADKTDALLSIRTPNLMSVPIAKQYEMRDQMLDLIDLLKRKGYTNVKFLCHDHRDIPFAASFKGVEYIYTEDVYTYLTYLRNTRLNLTYRLHSFIPCLSYDVPTIKISYDQRAISMLETLGMDDWNINLLTQDVLKEVEYRIDNIHELDDIKASNKENWAELRKTMVDGCEKFAELVLKQS